MKRSHWYLFLTSSLILCSFIAYLVQIIVFHRTEETFFYMLQDIAFVPVQVLLVTLFLNQLLTMREKRALLKKMNMLIGAFYIEIGTRLIKYCSQFSSDVQDTREKVLVTMKWTDKDFTDASDLLKNTDPVIDSRKSDLIELRTFLESKRQFLLSLLANPNLLEHDEFTDLLWAVFHLAEELSARESLEGLPRPDLEHLSGDIKRAYTLLLIEWISYMKHLKEDYPYLFSLAVRMNPMDSNANPVISD